MLFFSRGLCSTSHPAETRLTVYRRLKVLLQCSLGSDWGREDLRIWGVKFALIAMSGFRLVVLAYSEVNFRDQICSGKVSDCAVSKCLLKSCCKFFKLSCQKKSDFWGFISGGACSTSLSGGNQVGGSPPASIVCVSVTRRAELQSFRLEEQYDSQSKCSSARRVMTRRAEVSSLEEQYRSSCGQFLSGRGQHLSVKLRSKISKFSEMLQYIAVRSNQVLD